MKDPAQIKTMITSFELQKSQLGGKAYKIIEEIKKKTDSIEKFQAYSSEYQSKFCNEIVHNTQAYLNAQYFLEQLARVIWSEKNDLNKLEEKRDIIMAEFQALSSKLNGLNQVLEAVQREKINAINKIEDNECLELSVTKACYELLSENK